jgi:hypothetical protein
LACRTSARTAAIARLKQLKQDSSRPDIVLKRTAPMDRGGAGQERAVTRATGVLDEGRAVGPDVVLRPATPDDCRQIAELFRVSSEGVAD